MHEVAVFAKSGFGSVVVKDGKCHGGFSNTDRPVQASGCDLVREIQDLFHDFLSGKTIRRGLREGREGGKFRWGSRSLLSRLKGIFEVSKQPFRSGVCEIGIWLIIYERGIIPSTYIAG